MTLSRLIATLMLTCLGAGVAWAENATLTRASDLKAKPFIDAPTVISLPEQSKVQIIGNEGGWTQIRSVEGKSGWVRLLNVRPDSKGDSGAGVGKGIASLGNVVRTGTTGTTATTGTKGISQDDLARATPNYQEVKRMNENKVSSREAERYAVSNKLKARSMDYLETADGSTKAN